MAAKKAKAPGRNVAEWERNTERLTLRLTPATMAKLSALAKDWDCSLSEVVGTLIVNESGAS